jgi:isatin hydrolase
MTAVISAESVAAALRSCEIVDLTLTIAEDLPSAWATHMPFQVKPWNWFADVPDGLTPLLSGCGPYFTRWLLMDEHIGTHLDAPSHFVPPPGSGLPHEAAQGGITSEVVQLSQLCGRAAVIPTSWDAQAAPPGESTEIPPDVVRGWEQEHRELGEGDVVLFHTGWDVHYTAQTRTRYCHDVIVLKEAPGWPAPTVETIDLLLERGVRCVGTDAPSMGAAENGQPVHLRGLGSGMVYVEGLTSLGRLPADGSFFLFLPVKVRGGSGAPGRAVAMVSGG